jgi:NAD(P)-dependent dehydrogenase (short-subunit alcohol dehydrogenase family)
MAQRDLSCGGLRVLISGAAGGVGLACAHVFADRGAELILGDRDGMALTQLSNALGAFSRYCDVISETSVDLFAAEITAKFRSIDVLINAAGKTYVRSLGMTLMSRALLPLLRKEATQPRWIINIASCGGFRAGDSMFPYASSRQAFEGLSDALAEQTRGSHVSVVRVIPKLQRTSLDPARSMAKGLYRLERIDETATVDHILRLVTSTQPDRRWQEVRRHRRR